VLVFLVVSVVTELVVSLVSSVVVVLLVHAARKITEANKQNMYFISFLLAASYSLLPA
jgi:hypothetical protein